MKMRPGLFRYGRPESTNIIWVDENRRVVNGGYNVAYHADTDLVSIGRNSAMDKNRLYAQRVSELTADLFVNGRDYNSVINTFLENRKKQGDTQNVQTIFPV